MDKSITKAKCKCKGGADGICVSSSQFHEVCRINYTGNLVLSLIGDTPTHTPITLSNSLQSQTASSPRRPSPSAPQMKLPIRWRSRRMWMSVSSTLASCASTRASMSGAHTAVTATRATCCSKTDTPVQQVLKLT